MTTTLTVKGQVTVPKVLRDALGWSAGEKLAFRRDRNGVVVVRAAGHERARAVVDKLKQAPWNRKLTTARLTRLTRGSER